MQLGKQIQSVVLCIALAFPTFAQDVSQTAGATTSAAPSPTEMQQLVAPIALYPDALIAQILGASTYPTQVVEADRWIKQNAGLTGDALARAVDQQNWDDSVKGLTQFPSVLDDMSKNLSWTSSLGDAYYNIPEDVTSAIQVLRKEAAGAGNLKSTPEQVVKTENQTIIIEPAQPTVVYVPEYGPDIYGVPMQPYPGYSGWDVAGASLISFGVGALVGSAFGGGWGWGHWGYNWHGGNATFNRNTYVSRSNTFVNRNTNFSQYNRRTNANVGNRATGQINPQNRQSFDTNRQANRPGASQVDRGSARNFGSNSTQQVNRERQSFDSSRGFGQGNVSSSSARSGAFGGYSQGGSARTSSARGSSSFGGGGSRGGGGGGRGGGGGGRRR